MNNNRCVACGAIIPEGRQVCPNCEKSSPKINDKQLVFICSPFHSYDEIICKNPPTGKETVPYLRRVCRIFEIALNNALGIDHNYTDAYEEAEKEYEEEEARRNAGK